MRTKKIVWSSAIFLGLFSTGVFAESAVWKVTFISAIPSRPDVPAEYCQRFSPDTYEAPIQKLEQEGVKAQNGILVKYRNIQTQQDSELFFTKIDVVISKQLDSAHSWYTRMFVHLQQLTGNGVADGVWSTRDCKGRLIVQPISNSR